MKLYVLKSIQQIRSSLFIPLTIFLTGVLLLIYMIKAEGEPGAIPLAMTLGGLVWITQKLKYRHR